MNPTNRITIPTASQIPKSTISSPVPAIVPPVPSTIEPIAISTFVDDQAARRDRRCRAGRRASPRADEGDRGPQRTDDQDGRTETGADAAMTRGPTPNTSEPEGMPATSSDPCSGATSTTPAQKAAARFSQNRSDRRGRYRRAGTRSRAPGRARSGWPRTGRRSGTEPPQPQCGGREVGERGRANMAIAIVHAEFMRATRWPGTARGSTGRTRSTPASRRRRGRLRRSRSGELGGRNDTARQLARPPMAVTSGGHRPGLRAHGTNGVG